MVFLDPVHSVGEGHFTVLVVVAVTFSVGGDVGDLRGFGIALRGVEVGEKAAGEVFTAVEKALKGDGAGVWAIVEEDGDAAAFVEAHEIGMSGIDGGVCRPSPRCVGLRIDGAFRSVWISGRDDANLGALRGGKNGELDSFLRHEIEHAAIDGGLR